MASIESTAYSPRLRVVNAASSAEATCERASQVVVAEPFTQAEQRILYLLAIAFIVPFPILDAKFIATEVAMGLFVLAGRWRALSLSRLAPLLAVMAVPLGFSLRFPARVAFSSGSHLMVFAKLVVFVCFIYVLVHRCRNLENVAWLAKRVILPVSFVLCLSALVDRYTDWPFFVRWHQTFTADVNASLQGVGRIYGYEAIGILDLALGSGFATRSSDIPPWALFGLAAAYWLAQSGRMRRSEFSRLIPILAGAAFSMPNRSAVFSIGVAVLAFLLFSRRRTDRRRSIVLAIVVIGVTLAATNGVLIYQQLRYGVANPVDAGGVTKLLTIGLTNFGKDGRYWRGPAEIDLLLHDPRLLLIGSGWDFGAGSWGKPHITYIALVVGGGLVSLATIVIHLALLFRRSGVERSASPPGVAGIALLMAMIVELAIVGYLFYQLTFPASTLTIWIAWAAILYRNPPTLASVSNVSAARRDLAHTSLPRTPYLSEGTGFGFGERMGGLGQRGAILLILATLLLAIFIGHHIGGGGL